MMRGVVKWFSAKKGFGFIIMGDGGSDCFVHFSEILQPPELGAFKTLADGQAVEVGEVVDSPKGRLAKQVRSCAG